MQGRDSSLVRLGGRRFGVHRLCVLLTIATAAGSAATIDRLALVVGKTAFTQSEVEDELRLSQLEGGKPLDLSAPSRKEAAERLVDQQLLRDEIQATGFQPPAIQADLVLPQFCQKHFGSMAACRAAFVRYGVVESAVVDRLEWEVTVVHFTDERFAPIAAAADGQASDGAAVEKEMDAWLKQRRAATRIVFKQEAFQ